MACSSKHLEAPHRLTKPDRKACQCRPMIFLDAQQTRDGLDDATPQRKLEVAVMLTEEALKSIQARLTLVQHVAVTALGVHIDMVIYNLARSDHALGILITVKGHWRVELCDVDRVGVLEWYLQPVLPNQEPPNPLLDFTIDQSLPRLSGRVSGSI